MDALLLASLSDQMRFFNVTVYVGSVLSDCCQSDLSCKYELQKLYITNATHLFILLHFAMCLFSDIDMDEN